MYYCLWLTAGECAVELPFARTGGAKALFKRIRKAGTDLGKDLSLVQPGDVICWHRGKEGSWKGHIGIIEFVDDSGRVNCVEGNVGRFPAKVKQLIHDPSHERLVGYARLPAMMAPA